MDTDEYKARFAEPQPSRSKDDPKEADTRAGRALAYALGRMWESPPSSMDTAVTSSTKARLKRCDSRSPTCMVTSSMIVSDKVGGGVTISRSSS